MRKKILFVITVILILILLLLFPDILYHLRNLVRIIDLENIIICKDFDDLKYVELMLMPLLNCITIAISVLALLTAKASTKTQQIGQRAEVIYAAINIKDTIDTNMKVIRELSEDKGDIRDLRVDLKEFENAVCLYAAEKIDINDLKFYKKFLHTASNIKNYHLANKDEDKIEEIREFCKAYFEDGTLKYNKKLSDFISKVDDFDKL